jgi:hypothetical protein
VEIDHCSFDAFLEKYKLAEALFPGSEVMVPKFPLGYIEMEVGTRNAVGHLGVTPYAARHT